ncbi:hypothetical protein CA267_007785 [Alteromonas pelagimontana]|uniref:STAS/SEC14 domain-containing protein n=1 Tax=Alteromonas pelagimontana TaxID=1858656 RepID=A0A6M4MCC5_9ALTE|nr:hypothetical protein [Alteromonas pelagimontana]QJR80687.1 hypothetical protein CA267_007785 [Alteromonas pelagimontana]
MTNRKELYQLDVIGNVLCVRLCGVWSTPVVKTVFKEVQEAVKEIKHAPWAAYIDMRDWIMPTMEALEHFQMIYDWCALNNQTHEATVFKFAMQERIIRQSSSYDSDFHFYTKTPAHAEKWLLQKGFRFTLPTF